MAVVGYFLSMTDKFDLGLAVFMPIWFAVLAVIHAKLKKQGKSFGIWRLMCLVPLLLCVVHYFARGFAGSRGPEVTAGLYGTLYICGAVPALWQFFANRKYGHRITAVITGIAVTAASFLTVYDISTENTDNLSKLDYENSFKGLISILKKKYVLEEWKETDLDALEEMLLPEVREAAEKNDPAGYLTALYKLKYYMYDVHTAIYPPDIDMWKETLHRLMGEDHGFSMFTLDSGETVAVLVEEGSDAYEAGIHDGTVITKWNGTEISAAKENIECMGMIEFPVKENEDMLKAAYLAGTGGEQVDVTFIDGNGNEKTVSLSSLGSYADRLKEADIKFSRLTSYESLDEMRADNFSTKMLNENCGYMSINCESYNTLTDIAAMLSGKYPKMARFIGERLDGLKAQGMDRLIIDTRNNNGGFDEISGAVASLFTDEKLYINGMGKYDNGEFTPIYKTYLEPVGTYKDIPVVVLTNYRCASAGDGLVYDLSRCPNVTVMGITQPSGVNQFTGGRIVLTNSEFEFYYPCSASLDEDGSVFIDTKADRISRNPVDVKIPLTAEAAAMIFGDGDEDYELQYALEYIEKK